MTQRQVLLLQPHLASLDGHEHTQIKAIEWLLAHCRVTLLTRCGCALADQFDDRRVLPVFPPAEQHRKRAGANNWQGFDEALRHALVTTRATASDLLLVPSAGPDEIAALVQFYEREEGRGCPSATLRILSDDVLSGLDGSVLDRFRHQCRSGRMAVRTETAELRRRIGECYKLPVRGRFNLPCTILPNDEGTAPPQARDGIRIGVLGRQRSEKGSYRIPAILHHLRRLAVRSGSGTRISLVCQAVRSKRFRRLVLETRIRLGAYCNHDIRVEFIDSGMPGSSFRQLILDMDMLLLPYDTQRYRYSGSGIIMDAIAARKPIVHSRGMALNELLTHGNAEAALTDREFAEKLLQVATHLPRYQRATGAALEHLKDLFDDTARGLLEDHAIARPPGTS